MGSACRVPHENRDGSRSSGLGSGGHSKGFWTKVRKRDDGCWIWTSYLDADGAGKFCTVVAGKRRSFRAARFAWEQLRGPVPAGHSLVALVCWNRRCVNPAHREPVGHATIVKLRHAFGPPCAQPDNRGALCGRAILTDEAVLDIRSYRGVYGALPLLAKLYGVNINTARAALYGKTWRHLDRRGRPRAGMPLARLRELVAQRLPLSGPDSEEGAA